jgi:hypothetical protein
MCETWRYVKRHWRRHCGTITASDWFFSFFIISNLFTYSIFYHRPISFKSIMYDFEYRNYLIFATKFNESSILITIISWDYLHLSLANEYIGDVTMPTQIIKYNQCYCRWISQLDCSIHMKMIIREYVFVSFVKIHSLSVTPIV